MLAAASGVTVIRDVSEIAQPNINDLLLRKSGPLFARNWVIEASGMCVPYPALIALMYSFAKSV